MINNYLYGTGGVVITSLTSNIHKMEVVCRQNLLLPQIFSPVVSKYLQEKMDAGRNVSAELLSLQQDDQI